MQANIGSVPYLPVQKVGARQSQRCRSFTEKLLGISPSLCFQKARLLANVRSEICFTFQRFLLRQNIQVILKILKSAENVLGHIAELPLRLGNLGVPAWGEG